MWPIKRRQIVVPSPVGVLLMPRVVHVVFENGYSLVCSTAGSPGIELTCRLDTPEVFLTLLNERKGIVPVFNTERNGRKDRRARQALFAYWHAALRAVKSGSVPVEYQGIIAPYTQADCDASRQRMIELESLFARFEV